ncbi:hypothetical protein HOP50_19g84940 [Chloropicon primus]|uniref:Rhodanese domain-containing protein n=1 Tax=Chloropicon primus TaxID=1764295 RepID=A0A5B8N258_9CHLO|nr:hypothetical protein A3770_19p84630 [Chloropicon primus]UPR05146.1 hypothetical protein HOP50_19g84940 [Chloropicon primus]|mmetsp:Transcript_13866/g.39098  ORF Transcript_13866/g.39098 Transcript_13866/m.39098 type:complete len:240 (+) Transcript_13866:197-916(+)|eukprot:QDZ25945.1 hypothetical protein A3770_19p84630 [Chloropicon primus]
MALLNWLWSLFRGGGGGEEEGRDGKTKTEVVYEYYSNFRKNAYGEIPELELREAWRRMLEDKNLVVVDVRKEEEMDCSRIPGALSKDRFMDNLKHDKSFLEDKDVCCYCTIGYRSGFFVKELPEVIRSVTGKTETGVMVYNLKGSILGWIHEGYPVVSKDLVTVKRVHVNSQKFDLAPPGYDTHWFGKARVALGLFEALGCLAGTWLKGAASRLNYVLPVALSTALGLWVIKKFKYILS